MKDILICSSHLVLKLKLSLIIMFSSEVNMSKNVLRGNILEGIYMEQLPRYVAQGAAQRGSYYHKVHHMLCVSNLKLEA